MTPSERAFREDLDGAAFQRGLALGKWRIVKDSWPNPWIAVRGAERDGRSEEYVLRFDLLGYPTRAPTSQLWDMERDASLGAEDRPTGSPNIDKAFRTDWQPALYIPYDRIALESHRGWAQKPDVWKAGCDITHYLNFVHALINSPSYTGSRSAQS